MPYSKRPLMVLSLLLVLVITLHDLIFEPHRSNDHILNFVSGRDNKEFVCEGVVKRGMADFKGDLKLIVKVTGCIEEERLTILQGTQRLTVKEGAKAASLYSYGDHVRFISKISEPSDFRNPGGFKYKRYLLSKEIDAIGYVSDVDKIRKISPASIWNPRTVIEKWRNKLSVQLNAITDEGLRSVAKALVIGDDSEIDEQTTEDFRKSGLAHILVISGLNIGFVALMIFFLFKKILASVTPLAKRFNIFKPTAILTIGFIWIYTYLVGGDVSVVRASIMATVYLVAITIDRRNDLATSLAVAAIIIVGLNRYAMFDMSFQLSFIAVISIAIIYSKSHNLMNRVSNRALRYCVSTLVITCAAMIGVMPLLLYYFHYSSIVGIVSNLFMVPWAGFVITPLSLIVAFCSLISATVNLAFIKLLEFSLIPLIKSAAIFAKASIPFTIGFSPTATTVILFYILVVLSFERLLPKSLLPLWEKVRMRGEVEFIRFSPSPPPSPIEGEGVQQRPLGKGGLGGIFKGVFISLIALSFIGSIAHQHGLFSKNQLEVTFLDVGQGSSIFVRLPGRKTVLIDGGGFAASNFDVGKFVIAPFLWKKGINKIDTIVLTHAHPDHYKGLSYIAENFSPTKFIWNGIPPTDEGELKEWKEFIAKVPNLGVILSEAKDLQYNSVLNFFTPANRVPTSDLNDTSIVTLIKYKQVSILLTGDISESKEGEVLDWLEFGDTHQGHIPCVSPIDILQVPHHGSKTSTSDAFLKALKPEFAVIQAGQKNRYGFPNRKIMDRLEENNIKVLRTDLGGAITFRTDGKTIIPPSPL